MNSNDKTPTTDAITAAVKSSASTLTPYMESAVSNLAPTISALTPDFERLAKYLLQAKGPKRTMAVFAEETGVNKSTLSRIANGKITKQLPIEYIQSFIDHQDSDAQLTLEKFLQANGSLSEKDGELQARKIKTEELKRHAKNALVGALISRGVPVLTIPASFERRKSEAPYGIELYYDFNLFCEDAPQRLWYFTMVHENSPDSPLGVTYRRAWSLFLLDSWMPEFFNNQKNSFVFVSRNEFDSFVFQYTNAPIKSAVTAILIDPDKETVIAEAWLSRKPQTESVLDRPTTEEEGFIGVWEDGEEDDDD